MHSSDVVAEGEGGRDDGSQVTLGARGTGPGLWPEMAAPLGGDGSF